MKNAFQGNSVFEEAVAKINTATADYSTAVQDLTLIVGLHVFNQTQTVVNSVDEISVQLEKFILDRDRRAITTEPDLRENYTTQPFSSLFLVPYPRNQLFIGREPYFELIRTMLSTTAPKRYNHCVALFGLGGIGKTQIALEYAHRCRDEYNFVFWLHAAERTLLLSDYARIAQQTRCVKSSQDILPENMAVEVLNWMKGESNWLVVLDNVDDVTVVRGLLPETTSGGHVLITTRCNDVKLIPSEGLEVTVMEKGESLELLLAECDGDGQEELLDDARDIVDELGYLPLAISQAAAFIRTSDLSSFLEVFRSSKDEFLAENPEGNHPYPRSISMTWLMCLQRLSSDSIELLELISYLNPDEILAEFLERTIPAMGENLRRIIGKKFTYIKALSGLQLFSLIKVRDGGRKLSIHRLLQSVIRDSIPMPRRRKLQSEVLAMASLIFDSYSLEKLAMESRIQYRKFLPQFSSAFDYFEQDIYESFAISPLSESIAAFWYEEGQQNESEALNCKLLEIRKRKLGPEHPGTLRVMRGLGAVYAGFSDRYDLAIGIYEETLASQTRVLGPSDPDTLWTQHSLGVAYDAAGMSDKAATMLRETYNTRSLVLGKHHLHTLRTKFWLAMVYEHLGLGMEAKVLLEESMTDTTRTLGESHADTLRVMHCLASLYARQGRLSEAAQMFKKAFFLRRTTFGEHHWLTIQARDVCKTFENAVKEKEDIARYNTENIKRWCQRGNQSTGKSDECGRNVSRDLPGPNEDESEESDDSEEFANLARLF